MSDLGNNLRKYRKNLNLTLLQVMEKTGITDSRLSKFERNLELCPPTDLTKLAKLYNVSLISLYLDAGYLRASDISAIQSEFKNVYLLDEDEKKHIQDEIDFLNRKKDKNDF